MSKKITVFVLVLFAIDLTGCESANNDGIRANPEWVSAVIVGSAESPDPVLVWVKHLEREGKVRDVIAMESFPLQIRLTAPQDVIDEFNAMRKKLPPDPL